MFRFVSLLALLFYVSVAHASEPLRAVTSSSLFPLSGPLDSRTRGFNVELVEAIAAEAGFTVVVEDMVWSEAQARVAAEPGLLLFGATRTKKREDKYDWVTHLLTVSHVFMSTGRPVNSVEEARSLGKVGARSVYFTQLEAAGLINLVTADDREMLAMMMAGALDAVHTNSARASYLWTRDLGLPFSVLRIGAEIGRGDIWLAASKGYDRATLQALHQAAGRVKTNGTYDAIYKRYFGALPRLDQAWPEKLPSSESS